MSWPYLFFGSPDDPPAVFLHGFLGQGEDWLPVVEKLPVHGILPDLPGSGKNISIAADELLTFDRVSTQLISLFDELNLDQVTLVGYSMGGRIALYTGLRYPERIHALVVESANPGISDPKARLARVALDEKRAADISNRGISAFVDDWYKMPLFETLGKPGSPRKPHYSVQKMIEQRKSNNPRLAAKVIREMSPGLQPPMWDKLENISIPTLLICGALDTKYTEIMRAMSARLPNAQLEIIEDAGHNTHFDAPAQFADIVKRFVTR